MPLQSIKFKYRRFFSGPTQAFPNRHSILVSLIPVNIMNRDNPELRSPVFGALIDSGADCSIFPAELGEIIGLTIQNDRLQPFAGIGGHPFDAYLHDIILDVGGWRFATHACFALEGIKAPVLGQSGFFNLFEVKMDYSKEVIELKPRVQPLR